MFSFGRGSSGSKEHALSTSLYNTPVLWYRGKAVSERGQIPGGRAEAVDVDADLVHPVVVRSGRLPHVIGPSAFSRHYTRVVGGD